MGCRKNTVGATLCLCNNYDGCNDIERPDMIALMKLINLPDVQCSDRMEFQSFIVYVGINNVVEETVAAGCGQLPQFIFDLSIHPNWPSGGLFSGGCYELEDSSHQLTLGCICHHTNFCNFDAPFPITNGQVKCYISHNLHNASDLDNGTCTGHFCFVQKSNYSNFGIQFSKGCINVNDTMADVKLDVSNIYSFNDKNS
uniref:DUF3707 domain-containing protein n=1 Tax=Syphacia muris TaxID=451379 RepID=A0A0N5AEH7_9BILA